MGTEDRSASWQNLLFWAFMLLCIAAVGFYVWRLLVQAPEQRRADECRQTCVFLGEEYVGVTEYGCVCHGEWPTLYRRCEDGNR
jgi:hypothetical protein